MQQLCNLRFILKNNKINFLLKKKFLILFFFYQINKYKNQNIVITNNNFYNTKTILNNLIIKIYKKKWVETYVIIKKNLDILLKIVKKNFIFKNNNLIDIAVYDNPGRINRFSITILLQSIKFNTRSEIFFKTNELTPIDSLYKYYKSACWVEREIWDLFGIFFLHHNDLRRILTDYNFEGHPLRKDFPLSGYLDVFYDDKHKKIIYTPIELSQEYRVFSFNNIWKHV